MTVETAVPGLGRAERILVVEDDLSLQRTLKRTFEGAGFVVDLQSDAEAALKNVCRATHSAVVLDLTRQKESRKDLCREIRARAPHSRSSF